MERSRFPEKIFEIFVNYFLLSKGFDIYVPSQIKEAKLGYDALFQNGKIKIGILQYKIVTKYVRKPKEHSSANNVYYLKLHKDKALKYTQHNLLVKKANKGIKCGYAVPCFVEYQDLYDYYHNKHLLKKSFIIIPKYQISDKKNHYITFDDKGNAFLHSKEQQNIEINNLEDFINSIMESENEYDKDKLTNILYEVLEEYIDNNDYLNCEEKVLKTLYDNNMILVTYSDNN